MGGSEVSCCVPRCGKTRKDGTVLHSFPNPDKQMKQYIAWTQAVGIDSSCVDPQFVIKNRKVCHAHFEKKFLTWTRRLCPGAIPTLFLSGPANIEGPLNEIANTLDNVSMQPSMPSTLRAGPVSPKPAKLHVSKLDVDVGSTIFVSGGFELKDDEPGEDPLAIHSPDLGIKDSMCSVENIMNVVEDHNVSNTEIEENKSNIEDNMSDIEDNILLILVEDNLSNVEDDMSNVEDNMSTVEDNMSNVENNMSKLHDNMNTVEDSITTEKDNMNFKKDSRHILVDSFLNRDYDDLDLRLEIAYALKFKYQEGKTSKEAVEEIVEKYGRGKLSLEEAKCWYNEFNLGNNILRIIFSGGPIYK